MSLRSTALLYPNEKSLATEAMNYSPIFTSRNLTLKSNVCWAVVWEEEKGLVNHSKKHMRQACQPFCKMFFWYRKQ